MQESVSWKIFLIITLHNPPKSVKTKQTKACKLGTHSFYVSNACCQTTAWKRAYDVLFAESVYHPSISIILPEGWLAQ